MALNELRKMTPANYFTAWTEKKRRRGIKETK